MSLWDDLLVLLVGLLTGMALGALGSGGSILAMPAFVYALGMPVKSAVAASLVVVGAVSLLGAIMARRRCAIFGCPGQEADIRVALLFAAGGLVCSYTGARAATFLPDSAQMLLFGAVVIAACIAMARRKDAERALLEQSGPLAARFALWAVPPLGLAVGLLTGLVGVGGGFLIVPTLTLLVEMPVKKAIATSLWVIAANCATGLLGYIGRVPIEWIAVAWFIAAAIPGMMTGQHIARIANPLRLQRAFAALLLMIGVFTVTQALLAHRLEAAKKSSTGRAIINSTLQQ